MDSWIPLITLTMCAVLGLMMNKVMLKKMLLTTKIKVEPVLRYRTLQFGTPVHEIGHTLGLWHEQMRSDRDSAIRVVWENINQNYASQFSKADTDGYGVPYNYGSVMQYSSKVDIQTYHLNNLPVTLLLSYLVLPVQAFTSGDAVPPSISVLSQLDRLSQRHIQISMHQMSSCIVALNTVTFVYCTPASI